jgi:membrane-bound lytic murein transglycosylase A
MTTRPAPFLTLWYSFGAFFIVALMAMVWLGIRLTRTPLPAREVPISPELALVRYAPPPLRDVVGGDTPDPGPLLRAMEQSIRYYRQLPPDVERRLGRETVPVSNLVETLEDVSSRLAQEGFSPSFFEYLRENYIFYKTAAERVLVTGYYEPEVAGSLSPDSEYRYPLYAPPTDLVHVPEPAVSLRVGAPVPERVGRLSDSGEVVPYHGRDEIDGLNILGGRGLELVYLRDPIDRFFLHIQGSGTVALPDGRRIRVGFAAKNGLPYRPIGRLLVERGILAPEQVTMQSIRSYLEQHPEQQQEIFGYNPSYIFFRLVSEGPIGSIGVPITPFRTIATDNRLFPSGALAFLITDLPTTDKSGVQVPFSALVMNQDTGDAIRGPGRVDLFTGRGDAEGEIAGRMRQSGMIYFLQKKISKRVSEKEIPVLDSEPIDRGAW